MSEDFEYLKSGFELAKKLNKTDVMNFLESKKAFHSKMTCKI